MDPGAPDEPSREELESRVAELEQTVSKMLPDRRGVLKGLGAAAVGGAAVGGATGGASGQSATGQVGTESEPVDVEGAQGNFDSVSTDVLIHDSVENVKYYGAVGDGQTDDSPAIQDAADAAAPNGTLYLPDGHTYRLGSTIDIDLGLADGDIPTSNPSKLQQFTIDAPGAIKPDAGIGDGIHIHNGLSPAVERLRIEGGGQEGDNALRFSEVEYPYVGLLISNEYAGTWLNVDAQSQKGVEVDVGSVLGWDGQPILFDGNSSDRATGYGHIESAFIRNRDKGSQFRNLTDLSIGSFEAGAVGASQGVQFENVSSLWAGRLLVGGDDPITHVSFTDCNRVRILTALASLGDVGFYFDGVYNLKGTFVDNSTNRRGMVVENSGDTVRNTYDWDAHVYLKNSTEEGLYVGPNCGPQMRFHGTVAENATDGTVPNMDVQTTSTTWVDGMYVIGPDAPSNLNVVTGNDVRAVGSTIVGVDGSLAATDATTTTS